MFEISTRKWIPWNKSACYYASKNGHPECLKYLHDNGCPISVVATLRSRIHTLSNHLKGTTSDLQVASLAEKVGEDLVVVEASSVGAEEASHYESTHKE